MCCNGFNGFEDLARVSRRVKRQPTRIIVVSARILDLEQSLIDKCEDRSEGDGGLRRAHLSYDLFYRRIVIARVVKY